ncbi:hypothetical protein BDN72DRAFT_777681 [Pluteus cervinus]|uniref:Uncharacterized protein n=1 Tax=Pluteus cervinus TaxID=181527 RepID=A0ACD3AAT3_9AGAR|nr:hypothetical protein BDN72DRAFT_777681 [Pluteus cervinus]
MARSSVLSLTTSPSPPHDADPKSKSKSPELLPPPKSTGKEKAKARSVTPEPALDESNLLSAYVCPICYCPPTNATLTPCGHISCGPCLFAAVKTALQRNTLMTAGEDRGAKCPVCRASIPGWDGKGGGVIGLNVRAVLSL